MRVILLTSAIVLSLMCSAYIILEYFSYRNALKNNIYTLGEVIASNSSAALAFLSVKDANEILSALSAEKNIVAAALYDIDGKIFAKYPETLKDSEFPAAPFKTNEYVYEKGFLVGFQPVHQNENKLGSLYIKSDLKAMYSQLEKFALIGISLIIASLFVAFFLSRWLQKSISNPILSLEQTAKKISTENDYSVRANKLADDEMGALADAFNQMLSQIQIKNAEITAFNQKLEGMVSERTLDLQQQKEFVETIINASIDVIAVFDQDLNYIMLNKNPEGYSHHDRSYFLGKNMLEIFPQLLGSQTHKDLMRALKGEIIRNAHYRSPGSDRIFESYYVPVKDNSGKIYGVLTINHDITQIVESAESLESLNSELLKSNRDLEQFAYVASHDLQEPLRKIQTFAQLMGTSLLEPQKLEHYLNKINQSAFRMQQLIQDVLNFSRISNSQEAFVDTNLNEIIAILESDFELLFREKGAVMRHEPLPTLKAIPLQVTQLFANLISNSLKYSVQAPDIRITCEQMSTEEIKIHPRLNNFTSYKKIRFTDNGIGFESKFSEQIFNIFQRLHGKQTYSGTGIGLALCKKIVENHHGVIYAEGEPDKGATFTIILPG